MDSKNHSGAWRKVAVSQPVASWFPDDLVDAVAFADGVGHLAHEQRKAAVFILAHGIGRRTIAIKILKGRLVALRLVAQGARDIAIEDHLEAVPCQRTLGLARDRRKPVVAPLHGVPRAGGGFEIPMVELLEITHRQPRV